MSTRPGARSALKVVDAQTGVVAQAWDRDRIVDSIALAVQRARATGVSVGAAKACAIFAIAALLPCFSVHAAGAIDDARADIRATYDFEPSTMSFAEQAKRAPTLSALWDRYDRSREVYSQALRIELAATGQRELLYCDGGMLLLAKSTAADDTTLGLASLKRCSLAQIQHTPYFYTMHALARRGVDAFDLQARILEKPNYSAFIVRHAMSLGQDYAFTYPLLVQEEAAYVPRLIARLGAERDAVAQKSLARALWYAATPESEAALRAFAADAAATPAASELARKLLAALDTLRAWPPGHPTLAQLHAAVGATPETTAAELRQKRRARMRSISDEALHELEAYTALIYWRRGSGPL